MFIGIGSVLHFKKYQNIENLSKFNNWYPKITHKTIHYEKQNPVGAFAIYHKYNEYSAMIRKSFKKLQNLLNFGHNIII